VFIRPLVGRKSRFCEDYSEERIIELKSQNLNIAVLHGMFAQNCQSSVREAGKPSRANNGISPTPPNGLEIESSPVRLVVLVGLDASTLTFDGIALLGVRSSSRWTRHLLHYFYRRLAV
jgi:hypothetical protein